MIFQNRAPALNRSAKWATDRGVLRHLQGDSADRGEKAIEALEQVKIARRASRYHAIFELSAACASAW